MPAHFSIRLHCHYEILKLFKRLRLKRGRERKENSLPPSSESRTRSNVRRCKLRQTAWFHSNNSLLQVKSLKYLGFVLQKQFGLEDKRIVIYNIKWHDMSNDNSCAAFNKRYKLQTKFLKNTSCGLLPEINSLWNKKLKAPFALVNRVLTPNQLPQAVVPPLLSAAPLVSQFLSGPEYTNLFPEPRTHAWGGFDLLSEMRIRSLAQFTIFSIEVFDKGLSNKLVLTKQIFELDLHTAWKTTSASR